VLKDPPSDGTPWPPTTEAQLAKLLRSRERAFYLSTMSALPDENGKYRNRQAQFASLHAVVLDDIGTKVDPAAVEPTYVVESSPGNYQWGYVLDPAVDDVELADRLVRTLYEAQLSDSGGKLVNKYVRLPWGVNGKLRDGARDLSPVRLDLSSGPRWTWEGLLDAFGLDLANARATSSATAGGSGTTGGAATDDRLLVWLTDAGLVVEDRGEWVDIRCPWASEHSEGDSTAGYKVLGRGSEPDGRAFKCFHDHCSARRTPAFLKWVEEQGGPAVGMDGALERLLARYCFVAAGSKVVDLQATPLTRTPMLDLADFRNDHARQVLQGSKRGPLERAWLRDPERLSARDWVDDPRLAPGLSEPDDVGIRTFNTWRAPVFLPGGDCTAFQAHIRYMLPVEREREVFLDWLAHKLQNPAARSYGVVMVTTTYGTGRSTLGHILDRLWRRRTRRIKLAAMTDRGGFNEWVLGAQLVVIEELCEDIPDWRHALETYEQLKSYIDPRAGAIPVNVKHGFKGEVDLFANFLMFTNHVDALALPDDDRRLTVLHNPREKAPAAHYDAVFAALANDLAAGALYEWLMARDVSRFEAWLPPMTPAKQHMIEASRNAHGDAVARAKELLPGRVATLAQWQLAVRRAAAELGVDSSDRYRLVQSSVRVFKRFPSADPKSGNGAALKVDGVTVRVRALHSVVAVHALWGGGDRRELANDVKNNTVALQGSGPVGVEV
jgi:hypothetical protein